MTNFRKSLFLVSFYLLVILVFGQLDSADRPIINFASYFYIFAILIVPIMIFIPALHKAPIYVPSIFFGAVYFALFRMVNRLNTSTEDVSVVLLEFVLLEAGVWLAYQLAVAIDHSESMMDAFAQGTFPHNSIKLEEASSIIKTEFTRSRRYHRPLSLMVVITSPHDDHTSKDVLKTLQRDMMARLSAARVGQVLNEILRETDVLLQDRRGHFLILCPETPLEKAKLLAERVSALLAEKTGFRVACGVSAFPDEALNFEDLLHTARARSQTVQKNALLVAEAPPHGSEGAP
ncbi:MAG: hypothetical protein IT310_12980 [Anaerolineales bacterium]|nr:hypothetical protein [Anaerolineales bacterium]